MQFHKQPLPFPETRWFECLKFGPRLKARDSLSRWQDKSLEDKGCLQAREMVVSGEFVQGPGRWQWVHIKPQVREMTVQEKGWRCVDPENSCFWICYQKFPFTRFRSHTKSGHLTPKEQRRASHRQALARCPPVQIVCHAHLPTNDHITFIDARRSRHSDILTFYSSLRRCPNSTTLLHQEKLDLGYHR